MNIRMAAVAACALMLGGSPARADIIQATFTGVVAPGQLGVINPGGIPESALVGQPFSSTFIFDSTKSVPNSLAGPGETAFSQGLITASFSVPGFTSFSDSFGFLAFLIFANDFSDAEAALIDGTTIIRVGFGSQLDFFQNGTCPGRPCGPLHTTASGITNLSAVPGPIVGGGLPGLLAMLGLVLGWRRYVKERVKVLPS